MLNLNTVLDRCQLFLPAADAPIAQTASPDFDTGAQVIFIHRKHSSFPFARSLLPPNTSAESMLRSPVHAAELLSSAAAEYQTYASMLLALSFFSVDEYLTLLREATCAVSAAGPRAVIFCAAAVSDFYIPHAELPTHKLQSQLSRHTARTAFAPADAAAASTAVERAPTEVFAAAAASSAAPDPAAPSGTSASGSPAVAGGLQLQLRPVPKMLGAIKLGRAAVEGPSAAAWAPAALLVSFKLETDESILFKKALGSLTEYGVDVVVANLLQNYQRQVHLVLLAGSKAHRAFSPSALSPIALSGIAEASVLRQTISLRGDRSPGDRISEPTSGAATTIAAVNATATASTAADAAASTAVVAPEREGARSEIEGDCPEIEGPLVDRIAKIHSELLKASGEES